MNLPSSAESLIVILLGPLALSYMTMGPEARRNSLPVFGRMLSLSSCL